LCLVGLKTLWFDVFEPLILVSKSAIFQHIKHGWDFQLSFSSNVVSTSVDGFIKWNSDNNFCFILNIDGSCLGSQVKARYEGLIRNNSSNYLLAFSNFICESSDIMFAELFVIYRGFTSAKDIVVEELICLHYINLIKGSIVKYHVYV
jgi:hypothetical protein